MLAIVETSVFRKDVKRCRKRGKNLEKLFTVVERLAIPAPLAPRHRPHPLLGDWKPKWECQIEADWLLIYEVRSEEVILIRTGTHADQFE